MRLGTLAAALAAVGLFGEYARAVVILEYTATIQTIAGTPFGLDSSHGLATVTGSFAYDPTTPDTHVFVNRGDYPHSANGAFSILLPNGSNVTGSSTPWVQIEDNSLPSSDTFRFIDGPRPVGPEGGTMSLNGTLDTNIQLVIAISDGAGLTFTNDSLPTTFPFVSPNIPFHTFSLQHSFGNTASMQFDSITVVADPTSSVPEPSTLILFSGLCALIGIATFRQRRR